MRKLMMAVGAVAGLSLLAGCQENRSKVAEEQRDVAEAQANASEKVAEAREEAAQETTEAQRNAQQEMTEAQRNAQEETASARQEAQEKSAGAQQEAQEEIASAQQDIDEERKDVAEARQDAAEDRADDTATGGSGMAAGAAMTMTGTLKNVTMGDNLEVTDSTGKELKLKTDDQTKVTWNNKPAKLDNFDEGTQVRASYVKQGDDMLARDVTIVKPVMKK